MQKWCNFMGKLKSGFFFVHPRKKLKGPKTQETENSRKKLKTQAETSVFRHFSENTPNSIFS